MKTTNATTGMLARLSLAAGLLGAMALGVASAAPLGPQAGLEADRGLLIHVKKGKGGKHHHHNRDRIWTGIGAAIVLGGAYCAAQAESCDELYGDGNGRYWRCLRRAGCGGDDSDD